MALYENGTTFYGSEDLINWNFLSNINFGYECPDLFELPLDGNENNKKWILQDANGSYLVGDFDGVHFKPDKEQEPLTMDIGPDFYAAQTFPMGSLPKNDKRIIQIAWMDHWNGGVGETIWERNATFPVSLGLISFNGKKRITRNPISEITSIYESSRNWSNETITNKKNLLEDVKSKKFDLTAEFDISETTATQFGFKIGGKIILYDIHSQTFLGKELLPDVSKRIKIRLLIDWGQLEIFANQGVFSYSQQYAFNTQNNDIELFADGILKLLSMEFHEVKSTW
jgi:levanase/fructan beta-fructosidase